MEDEQHSRTAMAVAVRRAAHQLLDQPAVLDDPLAVPIVGQDVADNVRRDPDTHQHRVSRALRAFVAVRSRLAEDELARAVERGASQYVVLGAGLDTFAYRNPYPTLRVFEVDHPATQAWKRSRLAAASIAIPETLTFAPVDFEHQTIDAGLELAGFDVRIPAFFSWLGVTMYLSDEAIRSTLALVASTPTGGGLVFDYMLRRESLSWMSRLALDHFSRRVASIGEPFRTFFNPDELRTRLLNVGFRSVEDFSGEALNERYYRNRSDNLRVSGELGRIASAEV